MTLKEKFTKVEFEKYVEQKEVNSRVEFVKIANEFALGFSEWCSKYSFLPNKGWYSGSYQIEMGIFKTTKELLEMYKKEKGL